MHLAEAIFMLLIIIHLIKIRSEKLQNLASALSPCDIRLGGTYADFLTFDPNTTESSEDDEGKNQTVDDYGDFDRNPLISINNFTMTGRSVLPSVM